MNKILIIITFLTVTLIAKIDAELEVVKKAKTIPKIVVSISSDSLEIGTLQKIKKILTKDLEVSGHFELIENNTNIKFDDIPNILSLRNEGIDLFLNINGRKTQDKSYILQTKLFDINSRSMVSQKSYTSSKEDRYPFLAHRSAIATNDYLSAPSIKWMDKFVIFSVYSGKGKSDIMIGDYTLNFKKTIVKGGLNIFPKWASKEQKSIYYTSYNYDKPTLIKLNIFNRKKEVIMSSDGMIVASDVNKNGDKLLITASPNSQPDIYLYDLKTKNKKRVTTYSGIDVGAQFIEDESKIVFVSNRLGNPNIFSKAINSRGVEKLVYHSRNNSSATAYKDNIIYVSRDKENEISSKSFNLYLMSTKSDNLKRLTTSGINQFPKFSTDGESVLFIKNLYGQSSVGIIRLNHDKSFLFPLTGKKIQSIDW